MDEGPEHTRYEPLPRWGHVSVVIGSKLYLWGGRIEDFSEESKKELASVVEVFDFETELWEKKTTTGTPPSGLYNTAYTTIGHCLYVYGGWDGHFSYNELHQLDVTTMTWTLLKLAENSEIPMKMSGCGLVSYGKNNLVLFGGCGVPTEESQESSKSGSGTGTISYTTVRSNQGSKSGASQEEETKLLEVAGASQEEETKPLSVPRGVGHSGGDVVEVHSQPESMPGSELTEDVLELYDHAVSQLSSQVTDSQVASQLEELVESSHPPKAKVESQRMKLESQEMDGAKAQPLKSQENGKESHPLQNGKVDTQSEKGEADTLSQTQVKGEAETGSHSQENGESIAKPAPQENGEIEGQHPSKENGHGSQEEMKAKMPSLSQESGAVKTDLSQENEAESATPQLSQQNGEIKAQPASEKEVQLEGTPTRSKKVAIQTQSQEIQPLAQSTQTQPGEEESEEESDSEGDMMDRRWTNELKVFNIKERTWMTPVVRGELPPPSVDFSFTCLDEYRTLMYGGFQPESGTSSEAYILNMETWSWTKLRAGDVTEEVAWPVGRDGHASCLLTGPPNPQVLISGGWDKDNKLINDAWILNINARVWKELTMPVIVGARFWHSVACYQFSQRMKQLLFFGGCPGAPEELLSGGCWAKLAATVVVELGLMDPILPVISASRFSVDDDLIIPADWAVLDANDYSQIGQPNKRLKERVLLAEYRAIRAENVAREVMKKLETIDLQSLSMPYDIAAGRYEETTPLPDKYEREEEKVEEPPKETRPFWEISADDIELTGVDIGKGKWSIMREAIYRGDKVAARCLYSKIISEDNFKVFIECMDTAAKLRHSNLLPFIGAVLEGEPIIITELMPYNLKKVLEMKGQLLNYQIVGVALDIARALNFLHTAKPDPVVHGDLTSTSVLLEQGKGNSWRAKLSDFMTARFFKQLIASGTEFERESSLSPSVSSNSPKPLPFVSTEQSRERDRGRRSRSSSFGSDSGRKPVKKMSVVTPPDILDPLTLTTKRDVYSYGLLLVEMCSGSTPHVISLNFLLESITWTEMNLLIRECIELDPESRPSMEEILPSMAELHQSLSIGHGPSRPVIKKTFV